MDDFKPYPGMKILPVNMDFASLYPYFTKNHIKISKIKKILDNINDTR